MSFFIFELCFCTPFFEAKAIIKINKIKDRKYPFANNIVVDFMGFNQEGAYLKVVFFGNYHILSKVWIPRRERAFFRVCAKAETRKSLNFSFSEPITFPA